MNTLEELRATIKGKAMLDEWLGEGGKPVPMPQALRRGETCRACSENYQGNWLGKIKQFLAKRILDYLSIKHDLRMELPIEQELGLCKVCTCVLRLKVWTPLEHVKKHTSIDELKKFPSFCWIKKEIEAK